MNMNVRHCIESIRTSTGRRERLSYTVIKAVGKGTFGVVYEAEEYGTGRIVAVKKVFQDRNYKVVSFPSF